MASTMTLRDADHSVVNGIVNGPVSTTYNFPPGKPLRVREDRGSKVDPLQGPC